MKKSVEEFINDVTILTNLCKELESRLASARRELTTEVCDFLDLTEDELKGMLDYITTKGDELYDELDDNF